MSQIEQKFRNFLTENPEIEQCYQKNLINRRALAKHLIQNHIGTPTQIEAIIAMIRRFDFSPFNPQTQPKNSKHPTTQTYQNIKINIKDNITILDFTKEINLLNDLQTLITSTINYDKGDTLKLIIGNTKIKLFIDQENEHKFEKILKKYKLNQKQTNISELNLTFTENETNTKGIISTLTKQFTINNITITEMLTSTPEILFYLNEKHIIKAHQIIKNLKTQN